MMTNSPLTRCCNYCCNYFCRNLLCCTTLQRQIISATHTRRCANLCCNSNSLPLHDLRISAKAQTLYIGNGETLRLFALRFPLRIPYQQNDGKKP